MDWGWIPIFDKEVLKKVNPGAGNDFVGKHVHLFHGVGTGYVSRTHRAVYAGINKLQLYLAIWNVMILFSLF